MSDTGSSRRPPRGRTGKATRGKSTRGKAPGLSLDMPIAFFEQVIDFLKRHPAQLLNIPMVRANLASNRIKDLTEADIRTLEDGDASIANTVLHNLNGLKAGAALERPWRIIAPLAGIYHITANKEKVRVLTVGPRTENELFMLLAAGFKEENITGLDLISYSALVQLGDMHRMPFSANSFDIVILGWVLAYSNDVPKAVSEVLRVARPGAYVSVGWEYNPRSDAELAETGSIVQGGRVNRADEIIDMFGDAVDYVHFKSEPHPVMLGETTDVIAIFRLK